VSHPGGFDVAVVGASIAGCTAATLFARAGARVALVESHSDPDAYKRICTHIVQSSANPTLERLGWGGPIEDAGGVRTVVDLWTRWGWIPAPRDGGGFGFPLNIRRSRLDPLLRRFAAETSGVELMLGQTARRLVTEDGRAAGVRVEGRDGITREIRATLVVGADGRDSRVAEAAGLEGTVRRNTRSAYFAYYRDLPVAAGTDSRIWILDPDVAYAFPQDGGLTLLVYFPHRKRLAEFKDDPEGSLLRSFDALPDGPDLGRARLESAILGRLDMPNVSRPVALPGLALVGDAAMAADPAAGVGCGWALQSSEWLVNLTAAAVLGAGDLDAALKRYRKHHRSELAGHYWLIAKGSEGNTYGPVDGLLFSAAAKDSEMAAHLHAYSSRNIGPREFMSPRAVARAIRVNLGLGRARTPTREQ
jgi:2-polyprenyl-6-methoxyphenol hydroxylase-like FAD-dependent oxidoreductase